MTSTIEITLTPEEEAYADAVAHRRNAENRRVGRRDGKVVANSIGIDLQGARSELAVAKALGLKWDGKFLRNEAWLKWRVEGHDVGPLEIRSTHHPNGRLLLHPKDPDESPFILVLTHKRPVYILAGWYFGRDGKKNEWWWDPGYGRPCYFVPREQMKPMSTLEIPKDEALRVVQTPGA